MVTLTLFHGNGNFRTNLAGSDQSSAGLDKGECIMISHHAHHIAESHGSHSAAITRTRMEETMVAAEVVTAVEPPP